MIEIKFLARKFSFKILFWNHYFSPPNTFKRKGKDPQPDPDPNLWLIDPNAGLGAQQHTDADPDSKHWYDQW